MSFNGQEGGFFSSTMIVFGNIGSGGIRLTVLPILLTSWISCFLLSHLELSSVEFYLLYSPFSI